MADLPPHFVSLNSRPLQFDNALSARQIPDRPAALIPGRLSWQLHADTTNQKTPFVTDGLSAPIQGPADEVRLFLTRRDSECRIEVCRFAIEMRCRSSALLLAPA
jgi:hypothetical protein